MMRVVKTEAMKDVLVDEASLQRSVSQVQAETFSPLTAFSSMQSFSGTST